MKQLLFVIISVSILFYGCKTSSDTKTQGWLDDSVSFKEQIANNFGFELVEEDPDGYWHLWHNSDGLIYWDTIGRGPMNEKVIVRDAKGRVLVVAGRASEGLHHSAVKYVYDKDDNVEAIIIFPPCCYNMASFTNYSYLTDTTYSVRDVDSSIDNRYDRWTNEVLGEDYPNIICAPDVVDLAITKDYNKPYYARLFFKRNADGQITQVYDPILDIYYSVEEGEYLEYHVEEEEDFWINDIIGGGLVVYFVRKPNDNKQYDYSDTVIIYQRGIHF